MLLETGEMIVNNRIWCVGHRACNVWTEIREVRGATHLQACLELRSDSGIHWSFPETLWSVPIGAWAYGNPLASSGGPGPGPPPRVTKADGPPLPGPLSWASRRRQWDLPGKAISCQSKQKSLKMLKQASKRTLSICLTSLVSKLKLKGHISFCLFLSSCGDIEWDACQSQKWKPASVSPPSRGTGQATRSTETSV